MAESFFITGTDTDVGKTYVICEMLHSLRRKGVDAVGFKPVECGSERADSRAISEACSGAGLSLDEINPVWFKTPVAPTVAGELEGHKWELERVLETYGRLKTNHEMVLVEGAGGWMVPINREGDFLVSDLAKRLGLPVMAVVANRLGCLNHTALTVNQIVRDGLECRAVILNSIMPENDASAATNEKMIRRMVSCEVFTFEKNGNADLFFAD